MDLPASVQPLLAAAAMNLTLSDPVKYSILGVSVALLLLALGILVWQSFLCCQDFSHTHVLHGNVRRSMRYCDKLSKTGPTEMKLENAMLGIRRGSETLSDGSPLSSESIQAEGDQDEHANLHTQQVQGSLKFSLRYDKLQSCVVVTVLQAEGLPERQQARMPLPFVKLRLILAVSEEVEGNVCVDEDAGTPGRLCRVLQEWSTHIVKGNGDPLFGDQFSYALQEEELDRVTLRMEMMAYDKFSRQTPLGDVRVPLRQLKISSPLELLQDLQPPQKDLVGLVLLSLRFLPTSQRLEVGLLKVKIPSTDTRPDSALYARISVHCKQCKQQQKVSAVMRRPVTVFNQVLIFSLPELPLERCKVLVSLYDTQMNRKPSKNLIGQLTVEKQRTFEDKHWSQMMQFVRQPVAKWHSLFI